MENTGNRTRVELDRPERSTILQTREDDDMDGTGGSMGTETSVRRQPPPVSRTVLHSPAALPHCECSSVRACGGNLSLLEAPAGGRCPRDAGLNQSQHLDDTGQWG